jgi:hypothetical protein
LAAAYSVDFPRLVVASVRFDSPWGRTLIAGPGGPGDNGLRRP